MSNSPTNHFIRKIVFVATRLWRYQSVYFLKPHDAINDTLTASLLVSLDWHGPIVEIGSGDGIFSYIMHGGQLPLQFDRYLLTNLKSRDIYAFHLPDFIQPKTYLEFPDITVSIDAKDFHTLKSAEIGFARSSITCPYESLPFAEGTVDNIFYYIPHGLEDHSSAIREAARVLSPGGRMVILVYDQNVKPAFISYHLSNLLPHPIRHYFTRLDNGRFKEISNLSKSPNEWISFFADFGFSVQAINSGLSPLAWMFYDIQTRPILHFLIRIYNLCPQKVRRILKFITMIFSYPYLFLFYILFSNDFFSIFPKNCYLAIQLQKK